MFLQTITSDRARGRLLSLWTEKKGEALRYQGFQHKRQIDRRNASVTQELILKESLGRALTPIQNQNFQNILQRE